MSRAALIQFALVVAIFGAAAPMIQVGLVDATPTWFAFWRALLSAATTAVLVLLAVAAALEPEGGVVVTKHSVAAPAFLGVFGGPLATWAANSVSRASPAPVTSIGLLGVPLVSLALSALFLGEAVTLRLAVGAALILAALVVLAVRRALPPAPGSGITTR